MPFIPVVKGRFTNIHLSDSDSQGFSSHKTRSRDNYGLFSHTNYIPLSGVVKCHHRFGMLPQLKSIRERKPRFTLTSVNRKIIFHAFKSRGLNQPITWVGLTLISSIATAGTSTIMPSMLIAHLGMIGLEKWNNP